MYSSNFSDSATGYQTHFGGRPLLPFLRLEEPAACKSSNVWILIILIYQQTFMYKLTVLKERYRRAYWIWIVSSTVNIYICLWSVWIWSIIDILQDKNHAELAGMPIGDKNKLINLILVLWKHHSNTVGETLLPSVPAEHKYSIKTFQRFASKPYINPKQRSRFLGKHEQE